VAGGVAAVIVPLTKVRNGSQLKQLPDSGLDTLRLITPPASVSGDAGTKERSYVSPPR
jgi:hypothetical protein